MPEDVSNYAGAHFANFRFARLADSFALPDNGPAATIGGMLPPVAPIYQPLTIALGTATPLRMGVAAVGVLATTALLVPVAARVHAGAALSVRNRITLREALRRSAD